MGLQTNAGASEKVQAAERALRAGDAAGAVRLLTEADAAAPGDPAIKMQLATALRMAGDLEGALAAVQAALAIDPYLLAGLLSMGFILDKLGRPREAARTYRNALKITPPDERLPPPLAAPVARAREAVRADTEAQEAWLRDKTQAVRARHKGEKLGRFDEALQVFAGAKRTYLPEPALLHYPGLPPLQFYDRDLFPWLPELEAATDAIRAELITVMREDLEGFDPYIQYPPGAPVNQWVELNHSPRWNTYFLWKNGERQDAHCAAAPDTAKVLAGLPMLDQPGFGPTAMFSVLSPHTHIPPHSGSANTRLVVHLPLILPGQCRFRVGNDTRDWRMGEAWVFDDTVEHEAWNDSGQTRVVLIFDVWNPFLSAAERELVSAMMTARNAYLAVEGFGR